MLEEVELSSEKAFSFFIIAFLKKTLLSSPTPTAIFVFWELQQLDPWKLHLFGLPPDPCLLFALLRFRSVPSFTDLHSRLQQLDVRCETKTKGYDAYYKLTNTRSQIQAYVFDVIRASVPNLDLDDDFE
ncbi:hypothetical protein K1719_003185 [Acacia pycnantha]|nr:hypothetical protein K1719_003185 [Acacia pycnantha]